MQYIYRLSPGHTAGPESHYRISLYFLSGKLALFNIYTFITNTKYLQFIWWRSREEALKTDALITARGVRELESNRFAYFLFFIVSIMFIRWYKKSKNKVKQNDLYEMHLHPHTHPRKSSVSVVHRSVNFFILFSINPHNLFYSMNCMLWFCSPKLSWICLTVYVINFKPFLFVIQNLLFEIQWHLWASFL